MTVTVHMLKALYTSWKNIFEISLDSTLLIFLLCASSKSDANSLFHSVKSCFILEILYWDVNSCDIFIMHGEIFSVHAPYFNAPRWIPST